MYHNEEIDSALEKSRDRSEKYDVDKVDGKITYTHSLCDFCSSKIYRCTINNYQIMLTFL